MYTLYFHIGLHKTGTTFLQKEVFPKIDTKEFHYLGRMDSLMKYIIYQDPIYFDAERIRNSILEKIEKDKINLISNEDLSGAPQNGGLHRSSIISKIYRCFPDSKILLFIRKQDEWAVSNYRGSVRRGTNLSLKSFFEPTLDYEKAWQRRYPNPTLEVFLYYPYIKYIKKLFGDDALFLLPYEALKVDSDKVIESMCDFIGVEKPRYTNAKRNYSWGNKRIAFHRMINLFINSSQNPYGFIKGMPIYSLKEKEIKYITLRRLLTKYDVIDSYDKIINVFDKKFTDKKNITGKILERCIDDNKKIQKDFGIELEAYGYFDCKV